jgi:peroxiredoxin
MVEAVKAGEIGAEAPPFSLPGIDGRTWGLEDFVGGKGFVVMFICNHCPYVRAITERLVADVAVMKQLGIAAVAINANDAASYPADSFANMKSFAAERRFDFPYLHDQTQQVARAYDAVCTPDFFGFDADRRLQYRGRLDAGRTDPVDRDAVRRELLEAMRMIAETGRAPDEQFPSIGCSIKWKP